MSVRAIISCFNSVASGSSVNSLPVGFNWSQILITMYSNKYKVTALLHGDCLKYGLKEDVYFTTYGEANPYAGFLHSLYKKGVKIVLCHLCLTQDGFNDSDLLPFIKPISFSIDYILRKQTKPKHFVVYDAQLNATG